MKKGFKSKLESSFKASLKTWGIANSYETVKIDYTLKTSYTPDFVLRPNLFIETKGRFTFFDRRKHLLIKEQHPKYKIVFVFQKPYQKLYKGAASTYADWCDKHGFAWFDVSTITKDHLENLISQ